MNDGQPIAVSRRIAAPAGDIFRILADPRRHTDIDGSGMLRGAVSSEMITTVGDVFVMAMYFTPLGNYEMNNHVVVYEQDRRISWEPRPGRGHKDDGSKGRWGQLWSFELVPDGPDTTVVTESYDCSRAPEDKRAGMDNGRVWLAGMAKTLELLDGLSHPQRALSSFTGADPEGPIG
jgi:uncharacterized protein YndB with AHSA1/START domain